MLFDDIPGLYGWKEMKSVKTRQHCTKGKNKVFWYKNVLTTKPKQWISL